MSDTVIVAAIAGAMVVWGFKLRNTRRPHKSGVFDEIDIETRRWGNVVIALGIAALAYLGL